MSDDWAARLAPEASPSDSTGLLRIVTCGSVDDGKSTLLGRLLYDERMIYDDQLSVLEADSRRFGTQGDHVDFALLFDGLAAEREQGITIDVAYRFMTLGKRRVIVADAPGHEQYTRNMVTAASLADVAIILVDARKGLLTQTYRHSVLVRLLGVRHVVLAVNKLDLVNWSADVFERISADYRRFASAAGIDHVESFPISALHGDNVVTHSEHTPWYRGSTLVDHLKVVEPAVDLAAAPFRMPVQSVIRADADYRGFAGRIASGTVSVGDTIRVTPSGRVGTIERIVTYDGDLARAVAGKSVTLTLTHPVDVGRGDIVGHADRAPLVGDRFEATIVWMDEEPLYSGRQYLLKIGTRTVAAALAMPKAMIDIATMQETAGSTMGLNDIGICELSTDAPIAFDPYDVNRTTGGFILIDRVTNRTIAAGMIRSALRLAKDIYWQAVEVDKIAHARLKRHRPCIVWLTGLSGAGKSTIANIVEKKLHALGLHTYLLDGDNVRHGLCGDLGFTDADRVENVRRVAEVARLMVDAGLIVLVAFISPFQAERRLARNLVGPGEFCEVFVDAPLAIAESRDVKGLYSRARRGELKNFTGIDSPYERPEHPEVHVDTTTTTAEQAADAVVDKLRELGVLDVP